MWHGDHRARLPPIWNDIHLLEHRSNHFRISEYLRRDMQITDHRTFAANWNELGVHPVQQVMYLSLARSLFCVASRCLSVFLSAVLLSVCLFVGQSIGRSFCLPACLPACPTICLSVYLSVYLTVGLSVCMPVYLITHTHTFTHTHTLTHIQTPYVRQGKGSQRSDALQDTWDDTSQRMPSALMRIGWDGVEQVWYSITNYELCVHINICMYICIHTYMSTRMYTYVSCVSVCMCLSVNVYVYMCICTYTKIYLDIESCMCRYVDTCMIRHMYDTDIRNLMCVCIRNLMCVCIRNLNPKP